MRITEFKISLRASAILIGFLCYILFIIFGTSHEKSENRSIICASIISICLVLYFDIKEYKKRKKNNTTFTDISKI